MCFKLQACLEIKDSHVFRKWPVEYRWEEARRDSMLTACGSRSTVNVNDNGSLQLAPAGAPSESTDETATTSGSLLHAIRRHSSRYARYALAHSIGRWLLYPGSMFFLNKVPLSLLVNGRTRLTDDFQGKRAKLIARDGNEIDTMFVDRRRRRSLGNRGARLVICCEGNGSFYEVGCVFTPLKAGYSVLGWNHPGFARSTGKPYPQNDINAMEIVVQYAIHRLHFRPPDIVVYGYSLGSYTATWAGMTYPDLGALVLDAAFDSLLPLANRLVAKSWRKLVLRTIVEHFNLNVADMLCRYPGPVLLIRRTFDEITTTQFSSETGLPLARTNRANELLVQLLRSRYPDIVSGEEETVRHWLTADCPELDALIYSSFYKVDEDWCLSKLEGYKATLGSNCAFPWKVGGNLPPTRKRQMALFLAKKHLKNVETTHGRNLPPEEFEMPWKL